MRMDAKKLLGLLSACLLAACGPDSGTGEDVVDENNPFLRAEAGDDKADTAYLNSAGKEAEVDLEADIQTTDTYRIRQAPADLGQFALTYLRKRGDFYLESLAEDSASPDRVEWRIGTTWKTARQVASLPATQLKHFRIRGVNAVALGSVARGLKAGKVYTAKVPMDPFSLMSSVGNACADPDDHMTLDASIYWYMWNPDRSGCRATMQNMKITVAKVMPKAGTVYPEYDQLVADGKITAVILFGQIGDGAITDSDPGMSAFRRVADYLKGAKYAEVTPAPVGRRFSKKFGNTTYEVDLYSPRDFSGLGDFAHFSNLQKAISEHEIVAYDGHSMLGASDFWERPSYPSFYQIFLYGGCLGYEYYVRPILEGKHGWAKLDLMSAVVEVSADSTEFAVPALAKISYALTHQYKVSWQQILTAVRAGVGDDTFGASGVRDNCFTPTGRRCR